MKDANGLEIKVGDAVQIKSESSRFWKVIRFDEGSVIIVNSDNQELDRLPFNLIKDL